MEGARPRPRTVRLGKEIASLNSDLPLAPTSSVFVRVDEQNVTLWRALITGERWLAHALRHARNRLAQKLASLCGDDCTCFLTEPFLSL